ncbi:MAG: peroxidase-related enzyme [bacterium]
MQRIQPLDPQTASGKTKELLDKVQKKFGKIPNIMRTMAQSPAVLDSYLSFSGAISAGSLSPKLREQISLAVAQINHCDYCLAAHSLIGKTTGLNEQEILDARRGKAADAKTAAALKFAVQLAEQRGCAANEDIQRLRQAGHSDGEIMELVAVVALNIFTNYINHVAETEVDFPKAPAL